MPTFNSSISRHPSNLFPSSLEIERKQIGRYEPLLRDNFRGDVPALIYEQSGGQIFDPRTVKCKYTWNVSLVFNEKLSHVVRKKRQIRCPGKNDRDAGQVDQNTESPGKYATDGKSTVRIWAYYYDN